jgi:hypothetical protein
LHEFIPKNFATTKGRRGSSMLHFGAVNFTLNREKWQKTGRYPMPAS